MADPKLTIRIAGDLTAIKTALATLSKDVQNLGTQLNKTGKQGADSMSRLEKSVTGVQRAIGSLLTSFAALQAVKTVVGMADEMARINGVLKLATKSTEEFLAAQKGVFDIAQRTRAPLAETVNTYGALERTTRNLGLSQGDLLRTLETVNKAIGSTPVSAQAAQASLVQFAQALGGDFKAGAQELNSILEQTPGLAIAIAEGLGVQTSELKKMGEEGKLNTELVVRGLLRISDEVDKRFEQVPRTVSGALQQLKNQMLVTIGSADMTPLIEALDHLREVVTDPATVQGLTSIATAIAKLTTVAVEGTVAVADFAKWIGDELAARINGPAADDLVRISEKIAELQERLRVIKEAGTGFFSPFSKEDQAAVEAEIAQFQRLLEEGQKAAEQNSINAAKRKKDAAALAEEQKRQAEAAFKAAQAAQERKRREEEAAKESEKRQKQINSTIEDLENEAVTYGLAADEVVAYQLALLGATDAQIQRGREAARTLDRLKKETEATEKRKKAEEDLTKALADARIRLVGLEQGDSAGALAELTRKRDELLKQISEVRPGDQESISLVNRLFDVEAARVRANAIKDEADRLIRDLQDKEQSISTQISAGVISQAAGEQQIRAAREETIAQLVRQRDALQELYNTAPSPELLDTIRQFNLEIGEIATRNLTGLARAVLDLRANLLQMQQDFAGDTITALTDGLTGLFTSIADGSKSAGEALRDFVLGFAQAMLQIAAKALATFLVLQMLDAIYPGLGKATAAAMGAGVLHSGGIAGRGGTRRMVDPILFAAAPRYHEGGVAGLAPNEVPAILEKGEEVIPKNSPRNSMNGGGQAGADPGTRVVNVFGEDFVTDQMNSAAGEKVILNIIGRNPGRVKHLLG